MDKRIPIAVQGYLQEGVDTSKNEGNALRVLLIYPPRAYARMPYLAPYLLKGHIEKNSQHKVEICDLNLDYHYLIWQGRYALNEEKLNPSQQSRLSIVKSFGSHAWAFMRDSINYEAINRSTLGSANDVLVGAEYLEREISQSLGDSGYPLPSGSETWTTVIESLTYTPLGEFLDKSEIDLALDVIGISCAYVEQLGPALYLARSIKRKGFTGKVVIGGSAFTHILNDALKDRSFWINIDYGIPYEGEVTLLDLLHGLANKNTKFEKANVAFWRDGVGQFVKNFIEREVAHPIPDFKSLQHKFPTPLPVFPVLTSKGCYWGKCAFCTHHEGYGQGFSKAPNERIKATIEHISSLGGRHFYFVDEALPASKIKYLAELFTELERNGTLASPAWMAECRVEKYSTSPDFLAILANSGCKLAISGMETGSQSLMERMKKGVELEHAREFARQCKKFGIHTAWMFFIGFPGETLLQMKETFDLILSCMDDLDYATVGTFGLERDSPIWNDPSQYGISEILGSNEPYRLIFDYIDGEGVTHYRKDVKETLTVFLKHYPELMPKFLGIIERSCGVFYESTLERQ